jgi:hypothetical protein
MANGSEFQFLCGNEFSFLHVILTGSGTLSASYTKGTWGFFRGDKAARA